MGKKVIAGICALSIASATIMLVGGFWAQHSVSFYTMLAVRVLKVETTLLSVYIDSNNNDFCSVLDFVKPGFCHSIDGHQDLMDVSQRFCAPAIEAIYPQACIGFSRAYVMGITVVVIMAVSLVMQAIACWMLFQYGWQSAKHQYRQWSVGLIATSACLFAVTLLAYGFIALLELGNMEPRGATFSLLVLAPNRGTGIARGYMAQWVACLLQVFMVALAPMVEVSDEASVEEAKLLKQALAEQGNAMPQQGYGNAAMFVGPGPPQPGYGQAGVFMQAAPPPAPTFTGGGFGLQAPAPQPAQPQAMHPAW